MQIQKLTEVQHSAFKPSSVITQYVDRKGTTRFTITTKGQRPKPMRRAEFEQIQEHLTETVVSENFSRWQVNKPPYTFEPTSVLTELILQPELCFDLLNLKADSCYGIYTALEACNNHNGRRLLITQLQSQIDFKIRLLEDLRLSITQELKQK